LTRTFYVEVGDHVLQFYERDSDLITVVSRHLLEGLENDQVAVFIARPEHRSAINEALKCSGFDLAVAKHNGLVVELDAATTLLRLRRHGRIDRALFFEVIGQVIQNASRGGRQVRAYGEMVTLLWEKGDLISAMELESLWNELGTELPFSLICAYPSQSETGPELADALDDICDLHSHSLRPDGAEVITQRGEEPGVQLVARKMTARFQATIEAPAAARHLLEETLTTWEYDANLVNDASIVISELAGNAVVHVGRPFLVTIADDGQYVQISVRDADPLASVDYGETVSSALSGRGLRLVDAIAHNWGVSIASGHKTVWADLRAAKDSE
jgi:anti-sigma regulatory factor (Ser/Thr protein kinase)